MEARSGWKRYPMLYEVRGSDQKTMFAAILAVLDREHLRLNIVERDKLGEHGAGDVYASPRAARGISNCWPSWWRATPRTRWLRSAMKRRIEIKTTEQATIPFVKAHACGNDFLIRGGGGCGRALMRRWRGGCARATPALARMGSSFWIATAGGERRFFSAALQRGWQRGGAIGQWDALRGCVAGA